MRLRAITRLVSAAATVLLAAASGSALAQSADVSVTFTKGGESTARGAGLTLGGAETYTLEATNNGPSHVTSFVVDATFTPPAAPYGGAIDVTAPADCVATGATPFPCKVTFDPPLVSGAKKSMTIGITVPVPDLDPDPDVVVLPTAPADCPTAGTTVTATATIPAATVLQGATAVDGSAANNTPPAITTPIRPWADLSVTSVTVPGNAGEGQQLDYAVVLHNNGPCAATNVFSDFLPPSTLTLVSVTGCDNPDTFGPADDAGCDLASKSTVVTPFAVGADLTYGASYTVNTFPNEIIRAAIPVDVAVASLSPASTVAAVDDPDESNNSGSARTIIDLDSNKGCSTGGAATLLGGLLALAALRLGRRRSS